MKFQNVRLPRPVHWLIYAMGILLIAGVAVYGVAKTSWFRHILQQRIEASLSQITGGNVEITGMNFHPLELRISARKLIIRNPEKNTREPFFSAQDVVANVSPRSLTQLRPVLRTLEWQRAEVHVLTYPNGSTNLPQTNVSPEQGQALAGLLDLGIERMTLSHTTLDWNNQRIPIQVAARNVAIQLVVNQDHHYLGTLASSDMVVDWKARALPRLSFATTFKLSSNHLELSAFSWQIQNLRGHLKGSFNLLPHLAGTFEFRINGGLREFARVLKINPIESGYLYLDGKGTYGRKEGITLKGRMQVRELRLKEPRFKPGVLSFATDYKFAKHNLRLTSFAFSGLNARAEGDATISLAKGSPRIALRGQFENLSLNALMQAVSSFSSTIGIMHPRAIVNGTVNASWQQTSGLQSRFDFQFHPPTKQTLAGLPLSGRAQGSINLGREVLLTIKQAHISTPHSTMDARGTIGKSQSSLAVKFLTTDFDEWRPAAKILIETRNPLPITLRSQAVFTGNIYGSFSNPEIAGQVSTGSFIYGGWVWDSFRAGLRVSPHQVHVKSGRVKLGASSLTLDADARLIHWKLEPYSAVRLQATARETPLAGVRAALNLKPPMKGLLTGQVQAEGTVENLSGRGHFEIRKGEFSGLPFDLLSANVMASKSAWEASNIKLVEGQGHASGRMKIDPVQSTFSADLHGENFPLDQIHFLRPPKAGAKKRPEVSGLVSFNLQGQGSFDNARVHSTVDIKQLSYKGQSLGSVHGDAEWRGQQITLQIKCGGGQAGSFLVSGDMETRGDWPAHLSGQYTDFRADPWIAEFSSHSMGAEVFASGSFRINGPFKERSKLVASSQIQSLQINIPSFKLTNKGPVEVSYAGRNLSFKPFRMRGPSTNFEVGGSIHLGHPSSLDLSAKGEAAATLLRLVATGVQATGGSELEVRLTGTPTEPQLSGTVEIKDVGLGFHSLPFRLSALNGTIKLQGERAIISSLKGTIGGGSVNLGGFLVLRRDHRYRVQAELSQVRIRYPSNFTSVLDGKLTLAGTPEQGQLSGDVSVRNIFANESLNLVDFISGSGNLLGPSLSVSSPFTSGINLNVHLSSIRPVRIETHDLRVVTDIDLHLQGTLANPVAVGNVYLRSGSAVFRGNRYTLTRGDISMTNPFQTEPVLDMQVHTRIDRYDLTLEVAGPPDQIRFSYRSDPPLPTEDILSLLAFGYSKRLEEFAPQPTNPFSTSGAASALLSQALSTQVSGRIQRLFGVSRIKLSPTTGEIGMLGGPVLTVEQQLSPELTLTYQTSTANSLYRVIEFNWTVSPRMEVRGFRDQNGIFGLELKFRKRFK